MIFSDCLKISIFTAVLVAFVAIAWPKPKYDDAALGSGVMFDSIAERYDFINKFLSLGMDMRWRKSFIERMGIERGDRILDLATGTGDVAILQGKILQSLNLESNFSSTVTGIDPSHKMLAIGREKVKENNLHERVHLKYGDAQNLRDIPDSSFEIVSMAFGIRNIEDRDAALKEMARIAAPNATIAIMELHAPFQGPFASVGKALVKLIPFVLGIVSGCPSQYNHLKDSIFAFPSPELWMGKMKENGLEVVEARSELLGLIWMYYAVPIKKWHISEGESGAQRSEEREEA
mmetsp:Transcript_10973/g.15590  ORF Transcript_10973/g.15590 Transcript_10973/m.15590 type:complete len:291 (+) Transcript_10973:3-875(+)